MGNRAYFTLSGQGKPKTYYMHWNGGVDTIAPLCKSIFDANVTAYEQVEAFFKHLEIKIEEQQSPDAYSWLEENGHYEIDLKKQTLHQRYEVFDSNYKSKGTVKRWLASLEDAFNEYNNTKIRKECREKNKQDYWFGIQNEARSFFKREDAS